MDQPSLFSTDELILPESLGRYRKAVSAIQAYPMRAEHNHTLTSRRVFDALIACAQYDCRLRGPEETARLVRERISPIFEVRVSELARMSAITSKNYARLYDAMNMLFEMTMQWNITGEDGDVLWNMKSHFLSSIGIGQGVKRGYVRFSFDPEILGIVLEPSRWAKLSLQVSQGLKTPSSLALYQTCWRFIGTNQKVTAAWPTETWVKLLVGQSAYVKEDPKSGKVTVNYGDFKRRVLIDAIERVNDIAALQYTLELKEIYSGNRVAKLQFRFNPKKQASLLAPVSWPSDMVAALKAMGHLESEIAEISEAHSYEVVAESLHLLREAEGRHRAKGSKISSPKAYFHGILSNVSTGGSTNAQDIDAIAEQAHAEFARQQSEQRRRRMNEEFNTHQAKTFSQHLSELPESTRNGLISRFESSDFGASQKVLWQRGWKSNSALAVLRAWMSDHNEQLLDVLLPNPEDRSLEAWMAWRFDQISQ